MYKTICNMCGKEFDRCDEENFSFHSMISCGSKYDMFEFDLDLCCDCMDRMLDAYLIPECKYYPLINRTKVVIYDELYQMD